MEMDRKTPSKEYVYLCNADKTKQVLDRDYDYKTHFFVAKDTAERSKTFQAFRDHDEFYDFFQGLQPSEKFYYEVNYGDLAHKLYFDIDAIADNTPNHTEMYNGYVSEIVQAVQDLYGCDVLVFTSHKPGKYSYHVICGVVCPNHLTTKAAAGRVAERISEDAAQVIDKGVYKSVQQLRILGCHKQGINNTKVFDETLSVVKSMQIETPRELMKASFITEIEGLQLLEAIQEKVYNVEISEGSYKDAIEHLRLLLDDDFDVQPSNSGLIILTRKRPSVCYACKVTHERENAYVAVTKLGGMMFLRFYCRRNEELSKMYHAQVKHEKSDPRWFLSELD